MIQAIMLIALGFLAATLIGVFLAPLLWGRAYRLSRRRLEQTLPLTLAEIEATQDQLKASYAVRMRRLETALASAKQKAAIQLVDNSRLQMQIAGLKDQSIDLDLKLSERRNAATVLEQTITKRFPELDREIAAIKAQLEERSYELQDLANKLARRNEELTRADQTAAFHQEELLRVREALEKSAGERSGRRLRRPSQWALEDYKSEYDRLNLELSKLRQQLAQLQDRDVKQTIVIKEELQKLAELMIVSAHPRGETKVADRPNVPLKRVSSPELQRNRPIPWPEAPTLASVLESERPTGEELPDLKIQPENALTLNGTPSDSLSGKTENSSRPSLSGSDAVGQEKIPALSAGEAIPQAEEAFRPSAQGQGQTTKYGGQAETKAVAEQQAAASVQSGDGPIAAGNSLNGSGSTAPAIKTSSEGSLKSSINGDIDGKLAVHIADDETGSGQPPSSEISVSGQGLTLLDRLRNAAGGSAKAEK
ncbi:MAG: hypothetical protein WBX25_18305 [Rhodomicrobium sp.]